MVLSVSRPMDCSGAVVGCAMNSFQLLKNSQSGCICNSVQDAAYTHLFGTQIDGVWASMSPAVDGGEQEVRWKLWCSVPCCISGAWH